MRMLEMKIFSTTPPRPRALLKRKPTSVPIKTQFVTQHIAYAARHLAANSETSVRVINHASLHQNIFRRNTDASAGGILAGLDTDAVIARRQTYNRG